MYWAVLGRTGMGLHYLARRGTALALLHRNTQPEESSGGAGDLSPSAATPDRRFFFPPLPVFLSVQREELSSGEIDDEMLLRRRFPNGWSIPTRQNLWMAGHERHSRTSTATAAVSKVFEDNNLLIEILLRVGFTTTLVRAALVCKHWYHHASDRGFIKNFRKRHPPRLLGFYINEQGSVRSAPRFMPMQPQPLELAAVVRRVSGYNFGPYDHTLSIMDCRNGSVCTRCCKGREFALELHRPLYPEGGMPIIPPLPSTQDPIQKFLGAILSKEEEGSLSHLYVLAEWTRGPRNFQMSVYVLQDDTCCLRTMATDQILQPLNAPKAVIVGDKIYMAAAFSDDIVVFDFMASSLSRIPLPQEVKYHPFSTTLSQADDASGVFLTHVNELQLSIWLHKGDNWLLVYTICLHQMCANLRMLDHTLEDEHIGFPYLCHVGDNAEFVFLKMCGCTLYLDVTSKTLHKVLETAEKDQHFSAIYPFMMTWPPIFPALKDDPARNSM